VSVPPDADDRRAVKAALLLEDAVILLSVLALFILAVFFRRQWWGQVGLVVVLGLMGIVFVFRFRRVHRGFTGRHTS
jgi:small-conductance mechanosensitive channel